LQNPSKPLAVTWSRQWQGWAEVADSLLFGLDTWALHLESDQAPHPPQHIIMADQILDQVRELAEGQIDVDAPTSLLFVPLN